MNQAIDYTAILPELIMSGTIVLVLIADAFLSSKRKWLTMWLAFAGVVASLIATLTLIGDERSTFGGSYVVDDFAILFKTFFLSVAMIVLLVSLRYFQEGRFYQGEYYFLLLTAFLGCMMMPSSRDLLLLFIALELVSAPGFLIAAFRKSDPRSNEAGIKFFLFGVLSTAVMLYGMSLLYGVTGSLSLTEIGSALSVALPEGQETLVLASILFIVAGFAFKVSAVPFQFWAPDTYEGAPVPVAAFLATASKAAGFAGLLQLMFVAFPAQYEFWTPIFAALSILTMTIGNFVALQQRQIVRLLAYSSIAQAGYMLLPFALVSADPSINQDAFAAAVTYILIYAIMTLGAFAVVIAMARESRGLLISDFAGLGRRAPWIALSMTVFMVSLGGIPPTAGFWAKFLVFQVAIGRGGIGTTLAVIMVLNSVVSLYYYLAVPRQMLFVEAEDQRPLATPALATGVAILATFAVIAVGLWPELLAHFPPLSTLVGQ
ncbi:MAG TPA: NADH-quinone oxidoreductase subunit N [Actinomycetota bacterium]|nr:NADH-quinone oxidoreductase subunit N [Actinomycetota bacterium]